jgi:glycosyltransferase involved in cell wall biosynthesis
MKILFVTSYYSALQKSIEEDSWNPTGMPAIVKLFEGLKKKNIDFEPFFVDRNSKKDEFYQLKNKSFNTKVSVLKISKKFNIKYFQGIGKSYNSLLVFNKIKETCRYYDLIYVDRANIVTGAFFAFLGKKVVLRLHGVSDFYENYSKPHFRLMNPLKLLCLKAPFDYIICSEDGSPGKQFLEKYTKSNHKVALLNGVDKLNKKESIKTLKKAFLIPENMSVFLFLSRLSKDKGVLDFIDVICELQKSRVDFFTLIVGDGECHKEVEKTIKKHSLKNVVLSGAISHKIIYDYYQVSDVYISLNKIGNLSNTVLEAVNTGKCIVTLSKSNKLLKDFSTYEFFNEAALYVNRDNIKETLTKVMLNLIDTPKLIANKKKEVIMCQDKLITWDTRIEKEIKLLEGLIC